MMLVKLKSCKAVIHILSNKKCEIDKHYRGLWAVWCVCGYAQSVYKSRKTYQGLYRYGKSKVWVQGQHEPILKTDFLNVVSDV